MKVEWPFRSVPFMQVWVRNANWVKYTDVAPRKGLDWRRNPVSRCAILTADTGSWDVISHKAAEASWVCIHLYGFDDALSERKLLPTPCIDPGLRPHPARSLVTMLTVLPSSQRVWKELIICRCLVNHEVDR